MACHSSCMDINTIGATTSGDAPARFTEARFDAEGEPMWNFGPNDDGLYGLDMRGEEMRAKAAYVAEQRAKRSLVNKWLYATGEQVFADTTPWFDVKGYEAQFGAKVYDLTLRDLPKGFASASESPKDPTW